MRGQPFPRVRGLDQLLLELSLQSQPFGQSHLPAGLHPQYDAIIHAFAHSEAGRDAEARAALQSIGLHRLSRETVVHLAEPEERIGRRGQFTSRRRL